MRGKEQMRLSREHGVPVGEEIKTQETGGCPVRHLEDDFLMDGEFGNDVRQQQVPAVFAGRIHTSLGEQAGPRKGHQTAQFAVAVLVVVMDVVGRMLHQQRGILQEVDTQGIQHICLFLRVQDLTRKQELTLDFYYDHTSLILKIRP